MIIEYYFQEYMEDYIYQIDKDKVTKALKDIISADYNIKQTIHTDDVFDYFLYEVDGVLDKLKGDFEERLKDYFYEDALTQFLFDRSQE